MIIHKFIKKSVTPSSGFYSVNTQKLDSGVLLHVVIQATTGTTTFDFSITDMHGIVIKEWLRQTGELNEETYIPIKEVNTLAISNASADEPFNIYMSNDES